MNMDAVQTMKYLSTLLVICYTISSFQVLSVTDPKKLNRRFYIHNIIIFCLHFMGNISLILQRPGAVEALPYIGDYLFQLLFLGSYLFLYRKIYKGCNFLLLNHTAFLLSISFVILMRLNPAKSESQLIYAALATAVSLVLPFVATKIQVTKTLAVVLGVIGLLLLGIVFLRGKMVYGATLSLNLFGIAIQPSEFVKVSYILLIAMLFRKNHSFKRVAFTTLIAMMHVGILVLSKDLGNALIFFVTYLFLLYVATHTIKYTALGLAITVLCGMGIVFVYNYAVHFEGNSAFCNQVVRMFGHVETRINNWLDPWSKINSDGYQIAQSLFAIYSGGWFGRGLNKGFPKEIPVVEKDFTYAAIFEEYGGIVSLCILLVCLSLLLSILLVSVRMKNNFYQLMAIGFASVYGAQVLVVIGGVTKMIPHTGVTLPLISYGGSSVSSTLFLFALVQGLTVLWRKEEAEEKQREEEERKQAELLASQESNQKKRRSKRREAELPKPEPVQSTKQMQRKHKRSMEIFGIAYFQTACFIATAIYLIVLVSYPDKNLLDNTYNRVRISADAQLVLRGDILSEDGQILAYTSKTSEGKRIYPAGSYTSHVVGYISNEKFGLEYLGDYWLKQTEDDFFARFQSEVFGKKQKGYSLVSTLNLSAQKLADALLGDHMGAVVALDAETGDILVMVSKPNFDPQTLRPAPEWSDQSIASNQSYLLNRAINGLYPPGSSFKPVMMLAYMRAFPNRYHGEVYDCSGEFVLEDHIIHCDHGKAHGTVDFEQALCESCNGFFANQARSISASAFNATTSDLMFQKRLTAKPVNGAPTVPALSVTQSQAKMKEEMSDTQRAIMGIGQGSVLISPLHSALISAAIVNGGSMPAPRYFSGVLDGSGNDIYEAPYAKLGQVMKEEEASVLKQAMMRTLTEGTGYLAATTDYIAGGKTGSAQFKNNSLETHAIYTGFGERDGRKIAIAVFVEAGGSGGQVAAPIAKQILDELLCTP